MSERLRYSQGHVDHSGYMCICGKVRQGKVGIYSAVSIVASTVGTKRDVDFAVHQHCYISAASPRWPLHPLQHRFQQSKLVSARLDVDRVGMRQNGHAVI